MPSLKAEIVFELACLECGSGLDEGSPKLRKGVEVIRVKPCVTCMEKAREEGRAEGVAT